MSHEKAVADIVEQRRLDLGLSVAAVARKAGINNVTWRRVENGAPILAHNLAKVEKALCWPAGYLSSVLSGDEVVPYEDTPQTEVPNRRSTDEPIAHMFESLHVQIDNSSISPEEKLKMHEDLDEAQMRARRVQRRVSA